MGEYYDNDDFSEEELTEDEAEEALSAYDAMMAAEFDSIYARQAWETSETTQEMQEGDGFLHLT